MTDVIKEYKVHELTIDHELKLLEIVVRRNSDILSWSELIEKKNKLKKLFFEDLRRPRGE